MYYRRTSKNFELNENSCAYQTNFAKFIATSQAESFHFNNEIKTDDTFLTLYYLFASERMFSLAEIFEQSRFNTM